MPSLREVGLVGAALALIGGVVYFMWNLRVTKKNRGRVPEEKVTLNQNLQSKTEERFVEKEIKTETAREAPTVSQKRGSQVLVLGLDGAGKTSLIQCFATGSVGQEVSATRGFHAVSFNRGQLHIEFLEIGGKENLRDYWPMYMKKAQVLVFVLDAVDSDRFPQAKTVLHQLLASEPFLPLVLLANKQDLPSACGVTELYEALALGSLGNGRKLCVLGTQVQKDLSDIHPSVQDACELIIEMMKNDCG